MSAHSGTRVILCSSLKTTELLCNHAYLCPPDSPTVRCTGMHSRRWDVAGRTGLSNDPSDPSASSQRGNWTNWKCRAPRAPVQSVQSIQTTPISPGASGRNRFDRATQGVASISFAKIIPCDPTSKNFQTRSGHRSGRGPRKHRATSVIQEALRAMRYTASDAALLMLLTASKPSRHSIGTY